MTPSGSSLEPAITPGDHMFTLLTDALRIRTRSDSGNLTSTGWDGLPIPLRVCEVRRNSKSRRPSLSGNSSESGRSVTSKIAAILLTFADGTLHPLTEIAGLTGIPTSTVHRLVSELVASDFLERTDDSQYRVGVSLRAISAAADALPGLREPAAEM